MKFYCWAHLGEGGNGYSMLGFIFNSLTVKTLLHIALSLPEPLNFLIVWHFDLSNIQNSWTFENLTIGPKSNGNSCFVCFLKWPLHGLWRGGVSKSAWGRCVNQNFVISLSTSVLVLVSYPYLMVLAPLFEYWSVPLILGNLKANQ